MKIQKKKICGGWGVGSGGGVGFGGGGGGGGGVRGAWVGGVRVGGGAVRVDGNRSEACLKVQKKNFFFLGGGVGSGGGGFGLGGQGGCGWRSEAFVKIQK